MSEVTLQRIDYDQLTKIQKMALFMIVVGPETASVLLQHFDDTDVEMVCREMTNFRIVDQRIQEKVTEEFSEIITESMGAILGGAFFAQRTLEMAKGDQAANLLGRISPIGNTVEVIKEISEMEPRQIHNLIRNEQAQTIAFVVSHLDLTKAANLIEMLDGETQQEVVERIGTMEATSLENVSHVVQSLRKHFSDQQKPTMHNSGGVRSVSDLLKHLDKAAAKVLLDNIEQRNPALGVEIKRKMFSFEDLVHLTTQDLQSITREVDMADLVLAMKSANAPLQEAIYSSISKRATESLKEEMEMLGPVRLKEVEAAQDRIIQVVRGLEEEGEISLDQGGGDRVLV